MRQDAPTLKDRSTDSLTRDRLTCVQLDPQRAIEDLRQAQAKFKVQEAFLQSIYDGVEQQIFAIDVLGNNEFRYAGWNEMTEQALGISSAAARGKTPVDVFGVVEGESIAAQYRSCLQADCTLRYGESATIAGKPTWWLTTLKPLRDRQGKIVRLVGTKIDMSDYKRTSEEHDRFFNVCGALLCTAGFDGYFKQVNPACMTLLGYTEAELLATAFIEFVHPDDRAATLAEVSKLSEGQKIVKFENRYRCRDGSYRWLSWTSAPSPDRQLIYAVADDVTERKQAETKLQEQEQFLRSIYDGVEHLVFVVDVIENGSENSLFRYAGWNLRTAEATGISNQAVRGKTPEEAFGVEQGTEISAYYRRCLQAGTAITYEECRILKGERTWWLTTLNPLKNADGRIERLVGTTFDITQRQQTEAIVRESEEKFRSIVENANDLIFILNLDGTFGYVSPNCYDVSGYTAEAVKGQSIHSFVHPDDLPICTDGFSRAMTEPRISGLEYRVQQPDGTYRWHTSNLATVKDIAGNVLYCIGIARDITDRKQLEAQLRQQTLDLETTLHSLKQAQTKLVQSEKMSSLGQMVAGVAHEINNPVSFIHGNLAHAEIYTKNLMRVIHLYQQQYPDPPQEIAEELDCLDLEFLQDDMTQMLRSMRTGTERIREIVKSLRTFSRLHEANLKVADIHEGIEGTLMILKSRLSEKNRRAAIEVVKTFGKLPPIACYSGQLNQVLMNIIGNAIDAIDASFATTLPSNKPKVSFFSAAPSTPQHSTPSKAGKIHIRTEVVDDTWVAIHIADNGVGMSEEVRSKIFDPFFTTKPVGQGKGLGLSISYQAIVQTHGGELTCTSVPGEGSEFTIKIPIELVDS
jgi:PAS domain S-box-containing protein